MRTFFSSRHTGQSFEVASGDADTLLCIDDTHITQINAKAHTRLNVIMYVDAPETTTHTIEYTLGDGAIVKVWMAIFSPTTIRSSARLIGNDSVFEQYGLYAGTDQSKIEMDLLCEHSGTHTLSRTMISGVALDRSQISVEGMMRILLSGSQTDTHFAHEGLLLTRGARIDAEPGLEIGTNDVKATHSSAVHFLKPDQLFYLQTRSISEADARRMITKGFLDAALPTLPDPTTAAKIAERIESVLETL